MNNLLEKLVIFLFAAIATIVIMKFVVDSFIRYLPIEVHELKQEGKK